MGNSYFGSNTTKPDTPAISVDLAQSRAQHTLLKNSL